MTENSSLNRERRKYEVCAITTSMINTENMNEYSSKLNEKDILVTEVIEVGRFDSCYNIEKVIKKDTKINVFRIRVEMYTDQYNTLLEITRKFSMIVRFIVVREKNLNKHFDYKNPIELKKHLFESYRIHPIEITKFSKKKQKLLSRSVKRAKTIGIIGYKSY